MKLLLFITFAIVATSVLGHPPHGDGVCGPHPTKAPWDCCTGMDKLVSKESFKKCDEECSKENGRFDMCCRGNCMANQNGLLKDGKVDKDTSIASLSKAVENDKDWVDAIKKAVDECFNPESTYLRKAGPKEKECETFQNGNVAFCIKHYLMKNCPKPVKDEECTKAQAFMECVDKARHSKN